MAYRRIGSAEYAYGVAVAYNMESGDVVDCLVATRRVCVPYIPGLLAFREMAVLGPLAVAAVKKWNPDILLVDGHGVSHPRGFGIASHVGVAVKKPSIGVAKKKLVGDIMGDYVVVEGQRVARILSTPRGSKIYVSPGHLITLSDAYRIVSRLLMSPFKLPMPLHLADSFSKAAKKLVKPTEEMSIRRCPESRLLRLVRKTE